MGQQISACGMTRFKILPIFVKIDDKMNYSTRQLTPENIASLANNEVFVFGSNLQGRHIGGAARFAMEKFGAVWGKGVGHHGQTYAIPTMQGGVETIRPYVDDFIVYARNHPELTFFVTRIGCGIAGFKDEDIAPLFINSLDLPNVRLPKSFFEIILFPEEEPVWNISWYPELTPDIPLDEMQYESFCRGYGPDWDCRYAPIKIGQCHYFYRSGYWLKRYRYEKQNDGLYHLVESYTSVKEMGRNLLMECFVHGYYRPRVLEHEFIKEYLDTYGDYFCGSSLVCVVDNMPDKCLKCGCENMKNIISEQSDDRSDVREVIPRVSGINDLSHVKECASCHVRFIDESLR